ncbi:MAG: DUF362 domain-containing protein [Verrucomicrobia bacterium]|nr:DUF362 domain-containing protein [Verrucomicrobiota bacterium]
MQKHSRREFLAHSAVAAGAFAFGVQPGSQSQAAEASGPSDMAIARWQGTGTPDDKQFKELSVKLTERAIEALGGIKRFVSRGAVVWIKPNIAFERKPELAATTNPDVVATLVRLCFDAGAKTVRVGDNPVHDARRTYPTSGIPEAVEKLGAEVVYLDRARTREMKVDGERLKMHPVFPEMVECDLMINVPIVKHHGLARATMCMKNYMGVVENRRVFHQDIATCVADITRFMKPRICVLDATRVLLRNGPTGGRIEDVDVQMQVAAGIDPVALDAWGAERLGVKPNEIGTITKGQEFGLGKMDYRTLSLREVVVV